MAEPVTLRLHFRWLNARTWH